MRATMSMVFLDTHPKMCLDWTMVFWNVVQAALNLHPKPPDEAFRADREIKKTPLQKSIPPCV